MSGVKGKSGRKKDPNRLVNEALARVDQNLTAIFESLIHKAINGDREAQIYLIDRRLGKPQVSIESKTKGIVAIVSPDDYVNLMNERDKIKLIESKLISEYSTPLALNESPLVLQGVEDADSGMLDNSREKDYHNVALPQCGINKAETMNETDGKVT